MQSIDFAGESGRATETQSIDFAGKPGQEAQKCNI